MSLLQHKKIKTVKPEYMNYLDEFKPNNFETIAVEDISFSKKLLKKSGLYLEHIFNLFKVIILISIFGLILKMIVPLKYEYFGKTSFFTGIPFLRGKYFLFPIILEAILVVLAFGLYLNNKINEKYSKFSKFMHKLNLLNIPSFIIKLLSFYFIYNNLILRINNGYILKISGHVLATIISSSILLNIKNICQNFIKQDIKKYNFSVLFKVCQVVMYHNLYCLIFTCWIYHSFIEVLLSLFIGALYVLLIEIVNIDQMLLVLVYPQLYNPKKSKLFISFN